MVMRTFLNLFIIIENGFHLKTFYFSLLEGENFIPLFLSIQLKNFYLLHGNFFLTANLPYGTAAVNKVALPANRYTFPECSSSLFETRRRMPVFFSQKLQKDMETFTADNQKLMEEHK